MLKQMREGAKSTVLKVALFGLLLLAMAGLAMMDVQGMFRGGVSNDAIARVAGEKLPAVQFDHLVQNNLREAQIKQSDAYRAGIPMQILKQEIDGRLYALAARDMGIQVGDDLAAKRIKELLAPLVGKGMTEKEALRRMLDTYRISEQQLVAQMKSQISLQHLVNMVVSGAKGPAQLVNDMLSFRHEWRRGQHFTITADSLPGIPNPSDTELRAYYDTMAQEYALPEYRTLSVLVLDAKALGDDGKISDERLKQYYEENIADYTTPETRVVSQVVAPDEQTAKDVLAQAEKTNDLQKIAKESGKGRNTYVAPSTMAEAEAPAELAKAIFSAPAGKLLAPIKSPLGWHVVYVEKINKASAKPFSLVKSAIARELAQDKVSEALYQRANKIDDEIGGGKTLAEVASENGLQLTRLENIDAHGTLRGGKKSDSPLPMFKKILEAGFALQKGASSSLMETPDGAFLIVSADSVTPSEQQSFDKVRGEILSRWKAGHHAKALAEKSAQLVTRLNKGGNFDKIAQEFGKTVQSTPLLKRGTEGATVKLDEKLVEALFAISKQGSSTTVTGNGTVTLVRLAERKLKPLKELAKDDITAFETALNHALQQDLLAQYRLSLMDKYNVSINDKLMSDIYAPKDENGANAEE